MEEGTTKKNKATEGKSQLGQTVTLTKKKC